MQGAIGGSFAAVLILAAQAALEQQMKAQMSAAANLPPFPLWVAMESTRRSGCRIWSALFGAGVARPI